MRDARGRVLPGADHPRAKLTEAQVLEIRALGGTLTQRAIASLFGVSGAQVNRILRGHRWMTPKK